MGGFISSLLSLHSPFFAGLARTNYLTVSIFDPPPHAGPIGSGENVLKNRERETRGRSIVTFITKMCVPISLCLLPPSIWPVTYLSMLSIVIIYFGFYLLVRQCKPLLADICWSIGWRKGMYLLVIASLPTTTLLSTYIIVIATGRFFIYIGKARLSGF